jgi:hypothetical protein
MASMELDRQTIERRDFPIGRRGYDPAAVDAHLRGLAGEFDELRRTALSGGGDLSLASAASSQVQSIIQAAETAASEIERQALDGARQLREAAEHEAELTRHDAIEKARAHVSAVAGMTATLLERVGSMDGEVSGLIESLRAGAGRLAADLSAVETNMGELYDAASGRASAQAEPALTFERELGDAMAVPVDQPELPDIQPSAPASAPAAVPEPAAAAPDATDMDGARLIALNMALNGESRSDTERYLAENFQLPDRVKLVDEVYAAIEG